MPNAALIGAADIRRLFLFAKFYLKQVLIVIFVSFAHMLFGT